MLQYYAISISSAQIGRMKTWTRNHKLKNKVGNYDQKYSSNGFIIIWARYHALLDGI